MRQAPEHLQNLVKPTIEAMGYELSGAQLLNNGKYGKIFRIYIDQPQGITLDDCSALSHQLSGLLDVEDPIKGNYTLEVSSPGLDRALFYLEHFERFIGSIIRVRTLRAQANRREFKGELLGVVDENIRLLVDGEEMLIPYSDIDMANLVPELSDLQRRKGL